MKKIIFVLPLFLLSVVVFAQQPISDPNVQVREAKNFHAVHVSSAFKVMLTQGSDEKVAVSAADEKDLADIVVEVKNGVLYVGWDKKKWGRGNKKLKAYISFKKIDKLDISGACKVEITGGLKADGDFELDLSGASDLTGKIEVIKRLSVDLSGASDAKVTGMATEMKIEASGASSFKGFDFSVDYCSAEASGASDIKITVNKELSAHASGASDVDYKGSGVIRDIKTSGASSVSRS